MTKTSEPGTLVRGLVENADGPLPGVLVSLKHVSLEDLEYEVQAGRDATFELQVTRPGHYRIELFFGGYLPAVNRDVNLQEGTSVYLHAVMQKDPGPFLDLTASGQ